MIAKDDVVRRIKAAGIIPVVRAASADEALRVVEALRAGGLSILEITLTVPGAERLLETLARDNDEQLVLGAGSVLDAAAAQRCIAAGARFIVSPVLQPDIMAACRREAVAVLPGALTPTEAFRAWEAGADLVKLFPASALGGASYLRALRAPMPQLELVPTGGVTLAGAAALIEAGAAALGVGSELVDLEAVRRGQPGKVTAAARAFLAAVRHGRRAAAVA